MAILQNCWTPFMIYSWTTVKLGCYYASVYTAVVHILNIAYSLYVIDGGKSDEWYSPYFELNKYGCTIVGTVAIVYSFLFLLICIMLVYGVKKENRCTFFPWMIGMSFEILLTICIGIWYLCRYFHNPYVFLVIFVMLCLDGLHVYCLLCVVSQYQVLKELQEPRFIILHP